MDAPRCRLCGSLHYGLCSVPGPSTSPARVLPAKVPKASPLKPHHAAWLVGHPERTAEWLLARLADGFHVHHLDGDHSNNDPFNLVLIEHSGHAMLHGWRLERIVRPSQATFSRNAYQREYMRKWRAARKSKP